MIETRALRRQFRSRGHTIDAVGGVDIAVAAGEIVSFLGPNGAGKSTTLRMLTTLLRPTGGEARVAGRDLLTDPDGVRARIGYVPQGNGAGDDQRVGDELLMQGRLYGLPDAHARERSRAVLDQLELTGLADRLVGSLSGGQRRRLDIALGIVHRPRLIFLDEPSNGLDPQSRSNLWEHVRSLRSSDGTTVFLTTHYLDEADVLSDRVLVIDNGLIVAEGSPDELKSRVIGDLITFGTDAPADAAAIAERLPGTLEVTTEDRSVHLRAFRGETTLLTLLRELDGANVSIHSAEVRRPSLDDVFLSITGRTLREPASR